MAVVVLPIQREEGIKSSGQDSWRELEDSSMRKAPGPIEGFREHFYYWYRNK